MSSLGACQPQKMALYLTCPVGMFSPSYLASSQLQHWVGHRAGITAEKWMGKNLILVLSMHFFLSWWSPLLLAWDGGGAGGRSLNFEWPRIYWFYIQLNGYFSILKVILEFFNLSMILKCRVKERTWPGLKRDWEKQGFFFLIQCASHSEWLTKGEKPLSDRHSEQEDNLIWYSLWLMLPTSGSAFSMIGKE
jgi:hypothetical protein